YAARVGPVLAVLVSAHPVARLELGDGLLHLLRVDAVLRRVLVQRSGLLEPALELGDLRAAVARAERFAAGLRGLLRGLRPVAAAVVVAAAVPAAVPAVAATAVPVAVPLGAARRAGRGGRGGT